MSRQSEFNFYCRRDLKKIAPEGGLIPPWSHRGSIVEIQSFWNKSKSEQRALKKKYRELNTLSKKEIMSRIPGEPCRCCGRKEKKDSANIPSTNDSNVSTEERNLKAFPSLGKKRKDRELFVKEQQKKMKQKYSKQKSGEPAADVQRQCGQKVLEAIESVQKKFAKVLTMCTMPPKFDEALTKHHYDQQNPRVRCIQIFVYEVEEGRSCGGLLKPSNLRRKKKRVDLICSSGTDLNNVLNELQNVHENREDYELNNFYGTGERLMRKLELHYSQRKEQRARKFSSQSIEESQALVPMYQTNVISMPTL